jgi:competence protein ComEC
VLKVAHHGSASSSSAAFITAAAPSAALISVGADNDYGHPAPQALERLARIPIWRTDLSGTVDVMTDGARVWVRGERDASPPAVRVSKHADGR